MSANLKATYKLGTGELALTIGIGDGQFGTSIATINGTTFGPGDFENVNLGKCSQLAATKLKIKTIVTDVNDKTNHTSVDYILKDEKNNSVFAISSTVQNEGDSVIYRVEIELV